MSDNNTRNCPEPIIYEMMEVRAKEVAGLHTADQIRRMLLVFADAIEHGDHAQTEPAKKDGWDMSADAKRFDDNIDKQLDAFDEALRGEHDQAAPAVAPVRYGSCPYCGGSLDENE